MAVCRDVPKLIAGCGQWARFEGARAGWPVTSMRENGNARGVTGAGTIFRVLAVSPSGPLPAIVRLSGLQRVQLPLKASNMDLHAIENHDAAQVYCIDNGRWVRI